MSALWSDRIPVVAPSRAPADARYEYVVVGGGITGLATALMLSRAGSQVAVLEARHLGFGATGNTTAKLSVLQGMRLSSIAGKHTNDAVRRYVHANLDAQRWLLDLMRAKGVPFQLRDAYTYAQTDKGIAAVEAEFRVARRAGLPVQRVDELDTPFPARSAVALKDQAQFDPMDVVAMLAAEAQGQGTDIFENIRVLSVRTEHGDQVLGTEQGDVRAGTVVLATGTPILDRGGYFARLHPERSYAAAFDVSEELPSGMYLSADQPSRSVRTVPTDNGEMLLTGGAGHTVGRTRSEQSLVDELIAWTTHSFPTARLRARWSAQDYVSIDELPYVGPLVPGHDNIWVATGYAKWGMTNGIAAALMLSDRFHGDRRPWEGAFNSSRYQQISGLPTAAMINGAVGLEMVKGWAGAALAGSPGPHDSVAEGEGEIHRIGTRPVGVCTVRGQQHRVSAICPHLFGILKWNDAESSWDCPLHGSRFRHDGEIIEGPATSSLDRLD